MLEAVFDVPLGVTGPAIVLGLVAFALGGLRLVRRVVLPRLRISEADSDFSGSLMQAVMVFYGLAVALIAVSVWQSYDDVSKLVSQEATAIAALHRDVSGYPEPERTVLQAELRDYVRFIVDEAWPRQRRGLVPVGAERLLERFEETLVAFEPATEGDKLLHGEALRAFNDVVKARELRLDAATTGLPGVMWIVVLAGACIGLSASFFFKVEDGRLHAIQVTLLAVFIGLVIFMILALDRPFRGDLGLTPEPYELVYAQMTQQP